MTPNRRHSNGNPNPADSEPRPDEATAEVAPVEGAAEGSGGGPGGALEAATEALRQVEDRFLRLAAEYDNYRKRTTREKAESFDRGGADFAGKLLGVLDDFDRLLGADPAAMTSEAFREGVDLIIRKLAKQLEAAGLTPIDPAGKRFDPTEHDAVALAPAADPALDDTVANTLAKGYSFRGAVIRPAKVQVFSVDGEI
ncbi:MAG TPA: nucleotide exchange factor GrpE [Gemmatimonadales bacterium]|nr:nucleotide exchange factor GrpE [Gemmatimonadales bacterium]